jgi:tRNA threonylcarbamoyladenosine biosynthesis protein TsaE
VNKVNDFIIESSSPEATYALGQKLAFYLKGGDVICLSGNLGQGKTLFTKGIVAAFESEEIVTSPTFSLLNIYTGQRGGCNIPIYHFDLYRLDYKNQLEDIGFYEYVFTDGISIIEWADKFKTCLPEEYLWVEIMSGESFEERRFKLSPHGIRYEKLCRELTL